MSRTPEEIANHIAGEWFDSLCPAERPFLSAVLKLTDRIAAAVRAAEERGKAEVCRYALAHACGTELVVHDDGLAAPEGTVLDATGRVLAGRWLSPTLHDIEGDPYKVRAFVPNAESAARGEGE